MSLGYQRIVFIVVTAIVLLGVALLVFTKSNLFPNQRPLIVFTGGFPEKITLHELSTFGMKPLEFPVAGSVVDYVRTEDRQALLVENETGNKDVFIHSEDGWQQLTGDGGEKSRLAISSDGTLIAFAKRLVRLSPADSRFYSLTEWNVYVFNIDTGESSVYINAFAPQFFMRGGLPFLFFVDSEGVSVVKLGTDERQSIAFNQRYDGNYPPHISADGEHLAVYSFRGTYDVFPLVSIFPLIVGEPLGSLSLGTAVVAFSRDYIYGAGESDSGASAISSYTRDLSGKSTIVRTLSRPVFYKIIPDVP
jgi:hypothetical protein